MNRYLKFLIVPVFFLLSNCGFKVVKQSDLINFNVVEIRSIGEKRINYKLKNKLSIKQEEANKNVKLEINTKKNKDVKERNIKNEITKYQIEIIVNVKFEELNNNKENVFEVRESIDFNVASQYSQTLTNEKKAISLITDNLAEEIIEKLISKLNDY